MTIYVDAVAVRSEFSGSIYILENNGVEVDPRSIFDVQVKRLHEYKRQLLCAMLITSLQMKLHADPNSDFTPRTFVFGAKAAAGYRVAKRIIELLLSLADAATDQKKKDGYIKRVWSGAPSEAMVEKLVLEILNEK